MSTFSDVLQAHLSRRRLLTSGLAAAGLGWLGPAAWAGGPLGFTGVPVSTADTLVVPPGYLAEILYAWGDPISDGPAFKPDASNSVDDQLRQAGMHHDGMHFFPLPAGQTGSTHGLLAINHEYTDDGLLHPDGMLTWTAEKVRKSQAAHGVSVIEVRRDGGRWRVIRPSRYARRVTAATPMGIAGPAAGHAWMRTAADPAGRTRARHDEQLRDGLHPVGDLPDLRGERPVLLRQPLRQRARAPEALRDHRAGRRVPLARVRRALRRRAPPERAESLRLGRRDRSVRARRGRP